MKARVNEDLCVGCELCVATCPGIFSINSEGKAYTVEETVNSEWESLCRKAEEECPVDAIEIIDDEEGAMA